MNRPVTPDELRRMPDGDSDEWIDGVPRRNWAAVGFQAVGLKTRVV